MAQQQRVSCPAGVEARVDVEQIVGFAGLSSGTVRVENGSIDIDIADIEQFIVFEAILSSRFVVRLDVVQFSK